MIMPFFSRKHELKKGSPIRDIEKMRDMGIADKDIIKKLKDQGFSYDEIEKSMLQSLKYGVAEEKADEDLDELPRDEKNETLSLEDIYGKEEEPAPTPSMDELIAPGVSEELTPELAIEELVEGVINEKWEIFERELISLREEHEKIVKEIKFLESNISSFEKQTKTPATDKRIGEIETNISSLESRISGLEKAFKQFLPSLINNIRSLSSMIKEMKSKREEQPEPYEFKPKETVSNKFNEAKGFELEESKGIV